MKTFIKTFATSTLTAIILLSSAYGTFAREISTAGTPAMEATATPAASTMHISKLSPFNKVIISGNARVVLVQADKEDVRIYDYTDGNNIRISQKGYNLYIHVKPSESGVVYVHVKDLHRIDASQNSVVRTQGNFNLSVLQVFLQDNAKADVKATVNSMYSNIMQNSSLKLAGSCNEHVVVKSAIVSLKMDDFAALKTSISTVPDVQKTASLTSVSK